MPSGARPPRDAGQLILSCGGYRSGSTYCYNLVGEYVERAGSGRRIGYIEPSQVPLLSGVWSFFTAMDVAVGKGHDSPGSAAGAEFWPGLREDAATPVLPICTVRDFRDVLHSFSRKFAETPEEVLDSRRWEVNLVNLRWWLGAGALRVYYEDLRCSPGKLLAEMLAFAGLPVEPALIDDAVAATALSQANRVTSDLAPSAVDCRTLLHADHLADPDGGGWRHWDDDRTSRLRPRLEPLLEEFGYAW